MDPTTAAILSKILATAQTSSDQSKTFSDRLSERSAFIDQATRGVGSQIQGAIDNGSNGAAISPATLKTPAFAYGEGLTNKSTDLTNQMFGNQQQAMSALLGALGVAQQANQTDISRKNTSLEYQKNGFSDPYGATTGVGSAGSTTGSTPSNPLIESLSDAVATGKQSPDSLTSLTPFMKQQVLQKAYEKGFDPAKDINGVINGLESHYFNSDGKGSIAQGGDAGNTVGNWLSQLLSNSTGGAIKGGAGKINEYTDYSKSVEPILMEKLGINPDSLPKVTDSAQTAKAKIASLRAAVANKFYQGGSIPGQSTGSSNGGLSTQDEALINKYKGK